MRIGVVYALAVTTASAAVLAPQARADTAPPIPKAKPDFRAAPAKDCTRLNNRYGYYENPWCTPAEQRAWDIWEARQHARSAGN